MPLLLYLIVTDFRNGLLVEVRITLHHVDSCHLSDLGNTGGALFVAVGLLLTVLMITSTFRRQCQFRQLIVLQSFRSLRLN